MQWEYNNLTAKKIGMGGILEDDIKESVPNSEKVLKVEYFQNFYIVYVKANYS